MLSAWDLAMFSTRKLNIFKKSFEHFRLNFPKINIFAYSSFVMDCKMIVCTPGESTYHFLHTNSIVGEL